MNEFPSQQELPPNLDTRPKASGLWNKTVAFLRRDLKSFLPSGDKGGPFIEDLPAVSEAAPTAPGENLIKSLVDLGKLQDLAFNREVLDWRDNCHVNVITTLTGLVDSFTKQMEEKLASASFFRRLIAQPTDEVLQDSFVRLVRLPLIIAMRKEEAKLYSCAQKWGLFGKVKLDFDISKLDLECVSLKDIGFKVSNKELILTQVQELILGPTGIAGDFCDQATYLSSKLLEANKP